MRGGLVAALELDLVGPHAGAGDANEALSQSPSRWYLTSFLVPVEGGPPQAYDLPDSNNLQLVLSVRPVTDGSDGSANGVRSVSVFLVNRRPPAPDDVRDQGFIFQAELELT